MKTAALIDRFDQGFRWGQDLLIPPSSLEAEWLGAKRIELGLSVSTMARLPVIVTKFVKVKWLVGELPVDKKMIVVLKASVSEASIKPFAPF